MGQTQASSVQLWTTDTVPPAQRFDYFVAAADTAVLPFKYDIPNPKAFHASIEVFDAGPLSIMSHKGAAHRVSSGNKEIGRQTSRRFNMVMSRGAQWQFNQCGDVQLAANEAIVTDSSVEMDVRIPEDYHFVNIGFSADWLHEWVSDPSVFMACKVSAKSKWGGALTSFLAGLSPTFIANAPIPSRVIVDQVGALMALVADEFRDGNALPVRKDVALIKRIQDCIRQRCTELLLTAPEVATTLKISPRTLHRALGASGQTFGTLLQQNRIDIATRMLESKLFRGLTVADIGHRAGFSDASHFTRAFQKRMGTTPSNFRRTTDA
jgi:AraC-like DNA-binding protein